MRVLKAMPLSNQVDIQNQNRASIFFFFLIKGYLTSIILTDQRHNDGEAKSTFTEDLWPLTLFYLSAPLLKGRCILGVINVVPTLNAAFSCRWMQAFAFDPSAKLPSWSGGLPL